MRADRFGHLLIAAVMVVVLGATTIVVQKQTDDPVLIGYWWFGMLVISFCAIAFVIGRRYLRNEPAQGRVLCIVPTYNEPTEHLHACIESLLAQDYPVDIHVIDDGSQVPAAPYEHRRVTWHTQANTGKRGAQVTVLRHIAEKYGEGHYEYVLTVDSDSRPYPDALTHLLKAMNQDYKPETGERRIWAATGMIYIRNYAESIVSRAADMDIGSSCVMMRASRSMIGALETTSGALAIYPTRLLYDHLDAYAVECGTGDDRWLALRALERGEVVGVAEACVVTEMPTTLKGTYKQRLRWARSWWWMLPYVFRNLSPKQLISPLYGLTQLIIAPLMIVWAMIGLVMTAGQRYEGSYAILLMYIGAYITVRLGLSGLYLIGRPDMPLKEKVKSFLIGTLAAVLLNVFWLMPIRYWALFKLKDNRWQTRDLKPSPKHAGATSRSLVSARYALAGLVLLAGTAVSLYALTGGEAGPAQYALNPSNVRLFDDPPPLREPHIAPTTPTPTTTVSTAVPAHTSPPVQHVPTRRPTPTPDPTTPKPVKTSHRPSGGHSSTPVGTGGSTSTPADPSTPPTDDPSTPPSDEPSSPPEVIPSEGDAVGVTPSETPSEDPVE